MACWPCLNSRARLMHTSPSKVYPASNLQWHFTCGFDFRHSLWLPFEAAFAVLMGLSKYGITGNLLHWISDFLSKRRQCVSVNSVLSERESVIRAVPQGSILGTILFIFYMNDSPTDIIAKLLLFADDTKLIKMLLSKMSDSELRNDLNHLISWSEKWQLKFNK